MAIKKYVNSLGTFYHASTYLGRDELTGKEIRPHKRGFKTKKAAQDWIDNIRVNGLEEKPAPETFEEIYQEWIETYKLTVKPSTFNKTVATFRNHILPLFGSKKIAKITKIMCQKALNNWASNYIRFDGIYSYFKKIFTYAVQESYIEANPCDKVVKVKSQIKPKQKVKYLEVDQLNKLLNICQQDSREWVYPIFRLFAYTGMRRQELIPLEWSDIDFEKSTLSINKGITYDYENNQVVGETKNEASNAVIALDAETLNVLKKWRHIQATKYMISPLLFPARYTTTQCHSTSYPNRLLQSLCKKANIPVINLHGLRHTHCTLLIRAGVNIKDVQARMRHSDIETTLKIYTHETKNIQGVVEEFANFVAIS